MANTTETRKRSRSGTPSQQNPDVVGQVGVQSTKPKPTRNIVISDRAYMEFQSGVIPSSSNTEKDYVICNGKVYHKHPIYTNYGASKSGKVINWNTLKILLGNKNNTGYLAVGIRTNDKKTKTYITHRFIYECFHGIIPNDMVIDHNHKIIFSGLKHGKLDIRWE